MNKEKLSKSIEQQAEYIDSLRYDDLSDSITEQAKLVLLDSIGCIAAGNQQYEKTSGNGEFCLVGRGKCDKATAIFINGCGMVRNEMDEGNQFAFGHPACHIVPAFLAECQDLKNIDGKQLIAALVAAYEVACRWGGSAKIKPQMHGHGTMQTVGSAAVVAKLNKCSKEEIEKSIILANSLPQPTTWTSALHGDQIRNAYIGLSNEIGSNAHRMVRIGVESSIDTLMSVWSQILEGDIDEEGLVKDIGEDYLIKKNYFKIHAACRYTHSFVDTVKIFENQGLKVEDIAGIDIYTYHAASKLKGQEASNSFAAKFSIPVSLAIRLVYGELSIESMSDEHIRSREVQELAGKIVVHENLQYNEYLPSIRKNRIVITKKDGSVMDNESCVTKGDYLDPFSRTEVIEKFYSLTRNIWSGDRQKQIIDFVDHLDKKDNIQELFEMIGNEI